MKPLVAANVEVPAILLLEERGYALTFTESEELDAWVATRGDLELVGNGPLELLALASLAEERGGYWMATAEEIEGTRALRNGGRAMNSAKPECLAGLRCLGS